MNKGKFIKDSFNSLKHILSIKKESKTKKHQPLPDAKMHQVISFFKSGVRLVACVFAIFGMFELGFLGLFLAELVGIVEELV